MVCTLYFFEGYFMMSLISQEHGPRLTGKLGVSGVTGVSGVAGLTGVLGVLVVLGVLGVLVVLGFLGVSKKINERPTA